MSPEPAELLLDCPGSGRFQPVAADGCESASLLPCEVALVEEPELAGALQRVIVFRLEIFVLRSSYLIDSFFEVFGHVELVVDQLGSGSLFCYGIRRRRKHVGCHGSNLVPLLRRQGLEDGFRRNLRPVLNNGQNAKAIQI